MQMSMQKVQQNMNVIVIIYCTKLA